MIRLSKPTFLVYALFLSSLLEAQAPQEWITILVHGAIGFGANFSGRTVSLIKRDNIEGSSYERNVTSVREHPYLYTIQPIGKLGLHPVEKPETVVNAAYAFSVLYNDLTNQYAPSETNTFYTYGWSGLISKKRRLKEARDFYCALRKLIQERANKGSVPKIRIIGYSHGSTMVLNFATVRATAFPEDTFSLDETIFLGTPLNKSMREQITLPPFKKIYNIYSEADIIQRLDIFSGVQFFSDRAFLGATPENLTQIEIKYTAPLRRLPHQILPSGMRGTINQSPNHIELWVFGWTRSSYRKNLSIYPACAGVFIPYLIHAAQAVDTPHVQVDIRPEQEVAIVRALCGSECIGVPFMKREQFTAFINKALTFHPSNTAYKDSFVTLQLSVDPKKYK